MEVDVRPPTNDTRSRNDMIQSTESIQSSPNFAITSSRLNAINWLNRQAGFWRIWRDRTSARPTHSARLPAAADDDDMKRPLATVSRVVSRGMFIVVLRYLGRQDVRSQNRFLRLFLACNFIQQFAGDEAGDHYLRCDELRTRNPHFRRGPDPFTLELR